MIPIPGGTTTILAGVIALVVGGYVLHCEHVKKDRAAFIARLEAQAEAQQKEVERITKENQDRKDKADAETKRLRSDLAVASKRLRERADTSLLPAPSASASGSNRVCFGYAELDTALREFIAETSGIAIAGDSFRVDLEAARGWAKGR